MEILIFIIGIWIGVVSGYFLKVWAGSKSNYDGVIFVTKEDHTTLYSLVLEDYPDQIRFKKEVVFKVDASKIEEVEEADRS